MNGNRKRTWSALSSIVCSVLWVGCSAPPAKTEVTRAKYSIPTWDHGGQTLNHPRIHTVLWNDDAAFADAQILPTWTSFPRALADSKLYHAVLNDYVKGSGATDGFQPTVGSVGVAQGDSNAGGVYLGQVATRINEAIDEGAVPAPDGSYYDDFYVVLLPPNKSINDCGGCGGQHSSYVNGGHIAFYAVVRTGFDGGGIMSTGSITDTISHEYAEAVTDPICGTFYGGNCFTDEVGDNCDTSPAWRETIDGRPWTLAAVEYKGACTAPVVAGQVCSGGEIPICTNFDVGDFHNQNYGGGAGDWYYGSFKGECAAGSTVRGLSMYTNDHAHDLLCASDGNAAAYPKSACTVRNIHDGDDRGTDVTGDWDYGYWKGECGLDEYVAGVSQSPDGQVDGLLCCHGPAARHASCSAYNFASGDARESSALGDWDPFFYKGECGIGRYVAGVSVDPHHNGGPNSILCCQ